YFWPLKILVSAKMVPEPIMVRPSIERIENRTPCLASSLYHESIGMDDESQHLARRARWQAVRLEYAGVMRLWFSQEKETVFVRGTATNKERILFPSGEILYRKPFITQRADIRDFYTQTQYGMLPEGSPPDEKRLLLRGYGGFWEERISPEAVEPVFFQCINLRQQTRAICTRSSYWKRRGLEVFTGGVVEGRTVHVADAASEEEKETLGVAIFSGRARLAVQHRDEQQKHYRSTRFFKDPYWENNVDILFEPIE
ncbi:MAG: hypothetical protein LBD15_03990, partial [Holosporales bacterium]|nr:hypothetical protein [Holosporales bacterium]